MMLRCLTPVAQPCLVRLSLTGVSRKTYGRNLPETSPGVETKVRIRCCPKENVTLYDSVASYRGIDSVPRILYSDGSLGSGPLTSSIGYPKALAESMPDRPSEISSRPNNPRPELNSSGLRL